MEKSGPSKKRSPIYLEILPFEDFQKKSDRRKPLPQTQESRSECKIIFVNAFFVEI